MATKKALQQEVSEDGIPFVFEDETYVIPPERKWPLTVMRAHESGRMLTAVELLLGKDQFAKFEKGKDRTMGDLEDLLNAAWAAVEVDPKG